jgi:hypothetical protein
VTDWRDGESGATLDAEALAGDAAHGETSREKIGKNSVAPSPVGARIVAAAWLWPDRRHAGGAVRHRLDAKALARIVAAWRADRHRLDAEALARIVAARAALSSTARR